MASTLLDLRTFRPALLALGLLLGRAPGDETSSRLLTLGLEELGSIKVDSVFTASRFTEKTTDAPASVTILTRDEIKRLGYRNVGEAIRGVRSFDVTNDRNYTYLGVRGFNVPGDYGTRTLLLLDGHRMNDMMYDFVAIGTEGLLDVDLIERIEFVRGPWSAIYGSNAFFSVINIVPRRGHDIGGAETSASIGTFDAYTGRFTMGKRFANGLDFMLSGTTQASPGQERLYYREFDTPQTNHGIARNRDGDRASNLFGSLRWSDFTLQGGYVNRNKNVPTAPYASAFNERFSTEDSRGYLELQYAHKTKSGWTLSGRASYDSYDYHTLSDYDDGAGGIYVNNDSARVRSWSAEGSVSKKFFERVRLSLGAEYRESLTLRQRNYDEQPLNTYLDASGHQQISSIFIESNTQLGKPLSVLVSARFDQYGSFGGTLNPRFGLISHPVARSTVKLLFGKAFRAPNDYELHFSSLTQAGNDQLVPEEIVTTELVAEQFFGDHWTGTLSLYQNKISKLVELQSGSDRDVFANTGDDRVRGAEGEVQGKWDNGLLVRASYTLQDAVSETTGLRLNNSPRHVARTQVLVPVWGEKLSAGLELLYSSDRLTLQRQHSGETWLVNATLLSRELRPGLEVSASIYNVLDHHYRTPGSVEHQQDTIEQDGRTFRLKLTFRF